jgi:hypothetical protein
MSLVFASMFAAASLKPVGLFGLILVFLTTLPVRIFRDSDRGEDGKTSFRPLLTVLALVLFVASLFFPDGPPSFQGSTGSPSGVAQLQNTDEPSRRPTSNHAESHVNENSRFVLTAAEQTDPSLLHSLAYTPASVNLPGTWHTDTGADVTFYPNGNFVLKPNQLPSLRLNGRWDYAQGVLTTNYATGHHEQVLIEPSSSNSRLNAVITGTNWPGAYGGMPVTLTRR